ncbi:MAG: MBL fold metallo-hydrolase [Pseudanabaenaceae cyanobacterium]|jgi:glyoxylase-like metal-dependent hydrolase (beta-lactamase superfamily II)
MFSQLQQKLNNKKKGKQQKRLTQRRRRLLRWGSWLLSLALLAALCLGIIGGSDWFVTRAATAQDNPNPKTPKLSLPTPAPTPSPSVVITSPTSPTASPAPATPTQAAASPVITLDNAGLKLTQLAEGVYGLIASTDFPPKGNQIAICNGGIIVGSEAVLVIDPFQTPELGELVLATVKKLTDKPIRYVVNTHYHFDHTGGNVAFKKVGVPIVGRGLIREYIVGRRGNLKDFPQITPPDVIVNSQTDLWLGDRMVRLERMEGHSAGTDLVAYVPDAKVLFTGDMVFNQRIPYTGDGDLREWQGSLYRMLVTYPEAKVVPGHGDVGNMEITQAQQTYFNALERLAIEWKRQAITKEAALQRDAKVPEAYKNYKFQALYGNNLSTAYDQYTTSITMPLIP